MLLSGTERKIVFWYDDDASYVEEIDNIAEGLSDDCKVWKLTGKNNFATKLLLEEQDVESNYLIYAPFARPEDKENSLADTFYYSEHFYSDKLIQLMGDMSIPPECQDIVKKYKKFWSSGNVKKFQDLQIEAYTEKSIVLGMLCVLAGEKSCNFEQVLRKVVLAGTQDNAILKKLDNQKLTSEFWNLCEKNYGYIDSNPTLEKFLVTMLVTYMDTQMSGNIPKTWKSFLSVKQNDSVIFVKNLMSNDESKEFYDEFANKVSVELKVDSLITSIPLDDVVSCDALEAFDKNIISWIIAKIEDTMLDEKISGMTIPEICELRLKTGYHYSKQFEDQYCMLLAAYKVVKEVSLHTYQSSINDVINDYVNNTYMIDTYYRKFYYHMDRVGVNADTEKIRDLVENIYTNKYLSDFSYKWNQSLTSEMYSAYSGTKEEDFFDSFVKPFMREGGKEGRVIVIISDGMRYECARELLENFDLDEKCDAKINHMLSVLPSETTLGMAALLPHKDIVVNENLDITIEDMSCGHSIVERSKILQHFVPKSACYDFDVVMNAKQADVREMFQDKDVVYIYQDQIDARGEKRRTENEVFTACQEAIVEIQNLIRKLTGYISNTRYLVTADHGFIYKRAKQEEADKIVTDKSVARFKNKRYLLSCDEINDNAMISRSLTYLSKLNNLYVTTPLGPDIIKMAGGGQNYVHGGSSLQEMIVPVIKVQTFKGKQDTGHVNVELSNFTQKVTGIEVKLDFMQLEPVSDTLKPRRLLAFFVDADNHKISFDVPITANIKEKDAKARLITEKFTLKSGKYRRDQEYYLVLTDQDDETKELRRYKFEIDIADML